MGNKKIFEYQAPTLTVDCVIFQVNANQLEVLLIKRADNPFKGSFALPGGYNSVGETTQEAMARILASKTGIDIKQIGLVEQLYTFDTVARDPRGHAVSVSYMGLAKNLEPPIGKQYQNAIFVPVSNLPKVAFDHQDIINYALGRLRSKIMYTNAVFALLPSHFTLTELQLVYEAILDHPLDKRNFRKKILSLDMIMATNMKTSSGAHRPATLYKFRDSILKDTTRSLE